MDHTPADIIIVDEHFRKPLCRPMLTLQVDVATRVIPGFYISLEHPSAASVGMAIRHAVLPKAVLSAAKVGVIDAVELTSALP